MAAAGIVLVDTMIIIEAVETGCWNAITGQKRLVTVVGLLDRVVSLEALAASVGTRPSRAFKRQYTERILGEWRTSLLLGTGL